MQLYPQVHTSFAITTDEVLGLMARIVEEREVVPVESGDSTASNAIWALALIIIVALIVFGVWKSGILRQASNPAQKINVEVSAPSSH